MRLARNLLLTAAAATGIALLAAGPASARTICRADGTCFNTSGDPKLVAATGLSRLCI